MAKMMMDRRSAVASLLAMAVPWGGKAFAATRGQVSLGPPSPFSFDWLVKNAEHAARMPNPEVKIPYPEVLNRIGYDEHWQISFRPEAAPIVGDLPLQFFHLGRYAREPVRINLLQDGNAREVVYSEDLFDMPADSPAHELGEGTGFAGLRLMRPDNKPDWISFLGASYFRADGPEAQYGLSARGLALNTGLSTPEEFPRFSEFWVGDGEREGEDVLILARLDSPSVTGAYRIGVQREPEQHCNVEMRLFFRQSVERLGIAPLTSMFWYSEINRHDGGDWRPEVHDSDGLAIYTGAGERIWRPLRNPNRVTTTSFVDDNPRGFGLVQRDRNFENYQDDGVFYNRRPSAWIRPHGNWGKGAVQLVEIPTTDETFDNIVAYWTPEKQPVAGDSLAFDYTLEWRERDPEPDAVAHTVATYSGDGGIPGQPLPDNVTKYVIDFAGGGLDGLSADTALEVSVQSNHGTILRPSIRPVVGERRWRAIFDLEAEPNQPVELRLFVQKDGNPLTETWTMLAEK
ncbi:glucan biosynthesis protein D [Acuticoccus sp. M5D2P5]|uniref:glucan biosynthesis protein n=1 Tax=Acuticoccus kalidii TaxID=2910977 RepID=UPI001F2DC463|nr:glucan biosynthesis protein D [Acuticoccus kalidii]MCF3934534.1 glucan biosynthesis protein D [Acuticoccus kalidii]